MEEMILNLQMFADAGTMVTGTQNYVNAYTGETQVFDQNHSMSGEMKTYYDTELLENAKPEMFYAQFAKKQPLPANRGKTVEWRKWDTFEKAAKLQEGVIPTGQKFGQSTIVGVIDQYGTYASITDQLDMHAYDPVIIGVADEMGSAAAETQEALIRDGLLVNTNVLYCDNVNLADSTKAGTPVSCAEMEASDTVMSMLTPTMVAKAVTQMKKNRVPTLDSGKYAAVIHPSVAFDLRQSKEWVEAHKYAATEQIFNGEIGELHGCRFIESSFAPVLKGDYINKAGTATYATYMFGKDSFGIIDPEGGALEMIIKDKSQIGGPLNQFSTVGFKLETNGATILYPERLLRIMSCSSSSAIDEEN